MRPISIVLCLLSSFQLLIACGGSETPEAAASSSGAEDPGSETGAADAAPEQAGVVDPVSVSPEIYKVMLDGERMRILEASWKPDQRDEFHGHPPLVAYALTVVHGLGYDADESHVSIRIREGQAYFQEAVPSHAFENRGTNTARMVIIEMKEGKAAAKAPKDAARDAREASSDVYDLMLVNADVRVLLATWQPGQVDNLHSHPALAAYAVTDIKGVVTDDEGVTKNIDLKAGAAMFQEPVKAHTFKNTGEAPAKLLLIEPRR